MNKKTKLIMALGCMALACAGFAACGPKTLVEKNQMKGYKITVTYDGNGGTFLNRPGVTIIDQFNPNDFQEGSDGQIHIKLVEPTQRQLTDSADSKITLAMSGHFFAGWYQNREVILNDAGNPVDTKGQEIVAKGDGTYVYAETQKTATPAYTYSGYWDFEEDTLTYSEEDYAETDGLCNITLYAAWVEYYEFNYFYKMAGSDAGWTQLTDDKNNAIKTTFNYTAVQEAGSDKDTIWTPIWQGCKVEYTHKYSNNTIYQFPQVSGTTFLEAYTDENCQNKLGAASDTEVTSLKHPGVMVVDDGEEETLKVENRVQNVYMILDEGEQYRISSAKELVENPNVNGYYEICQDLDFTDLEWPTMLASEVFTGKMYGKDGNTYAMSNATVKYSSDSAYGGLFGGIQKGAEVKNLTFNSVTFDMVSSLNVEDGAFGLFAGYIFNGAVVENVTVNGLMRLGNVSAGKNAHFNILANGNTNGLTKGELKLQVYGEKHSETAGREYRYTINPTTVEWQAETGDITFTSATGNTRYSSQESIEIQVKNKNTSEVE